MWNISLKCCKEEEEKEEIINHFNKIDKIKVTKK